MKRISFKPALAAAIRNGTKSETRRVMNPQPPFTDAVLHNGVNGPWWSNEDNSKSFPPSHPDGIGYMKAAYQPGEIVGIAEAWRSVASIDHLSGSKMVAGGYGYAAIHYLADCTPDGRVGPFGRYRQARFLPDAFVRTKVRIVSVDAQRVQEITEEQAIAEGIERDANGCWKAYIAGHLPTLAFPQNSFMTLWDSIHADPSPVRDASKLITHYVSYPWDSDGDGAHTYRGKPWHIFGNPWVWVYRFELVK